MELSGTLRSTLESATHPPNLHLWLTGAGISAASGIPTFRGPEGFWRIGSKNYQPEEIATNSAFRQMPAEIWAWYLYRQSICVAATPNAAHHALVEIERSYGDRYRLLTQNVDGLHQRAGSERLYAIHGDLRFTRCADGCQGPGALHALDNPELANWPKGQALTPAAEAALRCPHCRGWLRPHVLWFDECYDEERYRFQSSLQAAEDCSLLVIVGTSGATTLPTHVAEIAAARGTPTVVIDPEPSPFTALAESLPGGHHLRGTAEEAVPAVARVLLNARQ